jgi:tetratricopeptide (TPR) repeat protein
MLQDIRIHEESEIIDLNLNIKDKKELAKKLQNVQRKITKLEELYEKVLTSYQNLNKKDSALFFYNQVLKSKFLNNDTEIIKARAYSNVAGIYLRDSNFVEAKDFSLKAIQLQKKLNNKISTIE